MTMQLDRAQRLQRKRGKGANRLIDYAAELERRLAVAKQPPVKLSKDATAWLQKDAARWAFWLECERAMDSQRQVDVSTITAYGYFNSTSKRRYLADGLKKYNIGTLSRNGDGGILTVRGKL